MSSADEARQLGDDELLMRWLDERNEHEARIGPDACLLERMTADRVAFAHDALGIDPVEAVRARADAEGLRTLALRHAAHYARRDVLPRPPFVTSGSQRQVGASS